MTRIIVISDTHNLHNGLRIPNGDFLIHCGDMTTHGSEKELLNFERWFNSFPHRHKIVIAGNHDRCLEENPDLSKIFSNYLLESGITINGIKFWGSPYTLEHQNMAFQYPPGKNPWNIPNTDILITHGPPQGIGDLVENGERVGCPQLLESIKRIKPHIHLFGHIHSNYGWNYIDETACINCSNHWGLWDKKYRGKLPPIVLDF